MRCNHEDTANSACCSLFQSKSDISWRASRWWPLAAVPAVALLLVVFGLPFLLLAETSLHVDQGLAQVSADFTASNYITFVTDPFYLQILARTVAMGLIVGSRLCHTCLSGGLFRGSLGWRAAGLRDFLRHRTAPHQPCDTQSRNVSDPWREAGSSTPP